MGPKEGIQAGRAKVNIVTVGGPIFIINLFYDLVGRLQQTFAIEED
jgi:hypothetical protein